VSEDLRVMTVLGPISPGALGVTLVHEHLFLLLDRGVNIQFDNFGKEFSIPAEDRGFAGGVFAMDADRAKTIGSLVRMGYERQILITNDICFKCMLHRFGGKGYDHVLRDVARMLLEEGIFKEILDVFMIENPRLFLTPAH
jgi:phosphotriesterase-related protein